MRRPHPRAFPLVAPGFVDAGGAGQAAVRNRYKRLQGGEHPFPVRRVRAALLRECWVSSPGSWRASYSARRKLSAADVKVNYSNSYCCRLISRYRLPFSAPVK